MNGMLQLYNGALELVKEKMNVCLECHKFNANTNTHLKKAKKWITN